MVSMTAEEAPKTLMQALLAVQKEIPSLRLGKDATGQIQSRQYKYLTLDKLMDAARPVLVANGLVWQTFPTTLDGCPALRYRLTHEPSGEYQEDVMLLMLSEQNSQGQGSAISYGRRYSFTAATDIVPDDDDDGAQASTQPVRRPAAVDPEATLSNERITGPRARISRR
jgi:hypothetical protein